MSDEAGGTWGQLVPELYYDLIARLPPGVVFWLIVIAWQLPAEILATTRAQDVAAIPFGMLAILLVVLGYVAVMVTVPISTAVRLCYARLAWRRVHYLYGPLLVQLFVKFRKSALAPDGSLRPFRETPTVHFRVLHSFLYEHLKHTDVQAKVLLPNMSAEVRLCDNLIALLLVFGALFLCVERPLPSALHVAAFILTVLLIGIAAWYRYVQLISKHLAYASTEGLCGEAA